MPKVVKWVGDALEGLMGNKMPLMKVEEINNINPRIKKVRFKGNLSGMNFQLGYAVIIRVSDTEFRNYTAAYSDVENGFLDVIFHIHGKAPGCLFVSQLRVGSEVRISMPRGQKQYDPQVKQQVIFGDETSLGLACCFQTFLQKNQHQFHFYFELDQSNQTVPEVLGLKNYTVFSKNNTFRKEELLKDSPLFKTTDWKAANFILTGNAASMQEFRKALKSYSITGKIYAKGYWLAGKKGL